MILENHDWSITDYTLSRQEFNKELVDSIKQVFFQPKNSNKNRRVDRCISFYWISINDG